MVIVKANVAMKCPKPATAVGKKPVLNDNTEQLKFKSGVLRQYGSVVGPPIIIMPPLL